MRLVYSGLPQMIGPRLDGAAVLPTCASILDPLAASARLARSAPGPAPHRSRRPRLSNARSLAIADAPYAPPPRRETEPPLPHRAPLTADTLGPRPSAAPRALAAARAARVRSLISSCSFYVFDAWTRILGRRPRAGGVNPSVSERLVAFASQTLKAGVPGEAVHEANRLIVNQLKASVGAMDEAAIRTLRDWALEAGRPAPAREKRRRAVVRRPSRSGTRLHGQRRPVRGARLQRDLHPHIPARGLRRAAGGAGDRRGARLLRRGGAGGAGARDRGRAGPARPS